MRIYQPVAMKKTSPAIFSGTRGRAMLSKIGAIPYCRRRLWLPAVVRLLLISMCGITAKPEVHSIQLLGNPGVLFTPAWGALCPWIEAIPRLNQTCNLVEPAPHDPAHLATSSAKTENVPSLTQNRSSIRSVEIIDRNRPVSGRLDADLVIGVGTTGDIHLRKGPVLSACGDNHSEKGEGQSQSAGSSRLLPLSHDSSSAIRIGIPATHFGLG